MALQTESYVADVLGKQAKAKVQYDRAAAANAQCLRGMEVQACEEYTKLADELGDNPANRGAPTRTKFGNGPCICTKCT